MKRTSVRPLAALRRATARGLMLAFAAGLLATGIGAAGAQPAAAAPAGPPTQGLFYIQNGVSGYNLAGGYAFLETNRPQGDESNQQWQFEASGDTGNFKIRNPTVADLCVGRGENGEGQARIVLRPCSDGRTDWSIQHHSGEQYRIFTPGTQERLWGGAAVDDKLLEVKFHSGELITNEFWYFTPVAPQRGEMPADPKFDQVTQLTAHNAFQNTEDDPIRDIAPNQPHSIQAQLEFGVRGLMLDIKHDDGAVRLCHGGKCGIGHQTLPEALTTVTAFLKQRTDQIVTLFLEDYTTAAQLKESLDTVPDVAALLFDPEKEGVRSKGWPKVSQMVAENKRLIIITDSSRSGDGGAKPAFGVVYGQEWTVENYWSMGLGLGNSNWRCASRWNSIPLSQEEKNFHRLFVMNHFRDVPMSPTYTNDNKKLADRAERFCMPAARKKPNYLAIDQYKDGDPMAAVVALNRYTYHGDTPGFGGAPNVPLPGWTVPRLAVMPLGDSITEGAGSTTRSSYRAALWNKLSGRAGTLDFVGSLQHGELPDRDHEGHSGWRIDQLQANIATWLPAARPNVVLLHIGTNDMNRNHEVATAPARLGALIDQITTAAPTMTVIVSSLVPSTTPEVQARVAAFNAQIPGLVKERRDRGYKVGFVDMASVTTADLNDSLHPNNNGYLKMADAFYGGIAQAQADNWITEQVDVRPAPPVRGGLGDYQVDFDGDGRNDYLVVGANGSVDAWLNRGGNGSGGWSALGQVAKGGTGATGDQVRFADVNGDRRSDYLVVAANGSVTAWLNNGGDGAGGWSSAGQIASGVGATGDQVRFGDVNGDGFADYLLLEPNGAVSAWVNKGGTGTAGWSAAGVIAKGGTGATGDQVRFADVNGDRRSDYLVVAANGSVTAWLNNGGDGAGGWSSAGQIASGVGATGDQVRFGDVNGDGFADYLLLEPNGAVSAWVNKGGTGTAGWSAAGVIASGTGVPSSQVRV
ncbi:FG-GAP-like repeat-containing protein [Streptomyces anulatus]|uniref:FG-GAP-like repeat-containing protein n=1 Tax=Streptomyces anulatus TaxID=1892 RepID=UPI002252F3CB|nr:FG-GAP-like repeat-containing protein [Streptomyces anulatus]MCX4502059.1 FG-GAP-like repeat-containing protein [Streptomyces anulatus]MCX4522718.1 FG-GAP-like repeat-containing protein [Streptomyces anulatus]MCX4605731.1 FG-GAP-like repeat-containing protein [Streptomyces anulatus]WSU77688.1 FG-GAP-like repeat-containing protein [Streptomyces anulatus]